MAKIGDRESCRVATLTNITLAGLQTIDGILISNDDRVLVKNQIGAPQNGIYIAKSGSWKRASDADNSDKIDPDMYLFIEQGNSQGDTGWYLTTDAPITLNTTPLVFQQFTLKLSDVDARIQSFTKTSIVGETPSGVINGTNKIFSLANPSVTNSDAVYLNGLRKRRTVLGAVSNIGQLASVTSDFNLGGPAGYIVAQVFKASITGNITEVIVGMGTSFGSGATVTCQIIEQPNSFSGQIDIGGTPIGNTFTIGSPTNLGEPYPCVTRKATGLSIPVIAGHTYVLHIEGINGQNNLNFISYSGSDADYPDGDLYAKTAINPSNTSWSTVARDAFFNVKIETAATLYDYTVSGSNLTFVTAPEVGSTILTDYTKA